MVVLTNFELVLLTSLKVCAHFSEHFQEHAQNFWAHGLAKDAHAFQTTCLDKMTQTDHVETSR